MDNKRISDIKEKLIKKLSPERYEHTIGVAYTAASLAMRYELDVEKAFLAGILHDCAKYCSSDRLLKKSMDAGLRISDSERKQPDLLHAKLGAYYAKTKYGVDDEEICHAIEYHTTGCRDMSLLDMIIYVSDYIEPNRNKAPNLSYYRHLAFVDIELCTFEILRGTIEYVSSKRTDIDPTTILAYEWLKERYNDNTGKN